MSTNSFKRTFNSHPKPSSQLLSLYSKVSTSFHGIILLLSLSHRIIVGAFLGALSSAFVGEQLRRRISILIGTLVMIIGSLLQATAYTLSHLIFTRIVAGFGLDIVNSTAPVLQSEYSPKANRGLCKCTLVSSSTPDVLNPEVVYMQLSPLNFGTALIYWIDFGFNSTGHVVSYAWRVPCILQCNFLFPMLFLALPTRWLAAHDRSEESLAVLRRLWGKIEVDDIIVGLHKDIVRTAAKEKEMSAGFWKDLVKNDKIKSQRRFLTACAIQIFQQLGRINAIIYKATFKACK